MSDFNIDTGRLDKRITIQKFTEQQTDADGFPIEGSGGYVYFKKVWANINNLFANAYFAAKAVNEEDTVNFIIRYSSDISDMEEKDGCKKYKIIYKKKTYDIFFADNVASQNTWYKLKAKAVN